MTNLIKELVKEIAGSKDLSAAAEKAADTIIGDKLEGCFKTYAIKESIALVIDDQWIKGLKEDHGYIKDVEVKDGGNRYIFTFANNNSVDISRTSLRLHGWADICSSLTAKYKEGLFND